MVLRNSRITACVTWHSFRTSRRRAARTPRWSPRPGRQRRVLPVCAVFASHTQQRKLVLDVIRRYHESRRDNLGLHACSGNKNTRGKRHVVNKIGTSARYLPIGFGASRSS